MAKIVKSQITEIFEFWRTAAGHPAARLLPVRSRAIAARLREGYSVEFIKSAIRGCLASPFHRGQNETGTVYDDLTLICRNGAKLEQFANYFNRRRPASQRPTQPEPAYIPACPTCRGVGLVDSHPDNPGFVPDRKFTPCPACSPSPPT